MTGYTNMPETMVDGTHFPYDDTFSYPDVFTRVYLADPHTEQPEYNFNDIFGCNPLFDEPVDTVKAAPEFLSTQSFFDLPTTTVSNSPSDYSSCSSVEQTTLYPVEDCNDGFTGSPTSKYVCNTANVVEKFTRSPSQTPSFGADKKQPQRHASPDLSPRKRRSLDGTTNSDAVEEKPHKKKRGRPRIHRTDDTTASFSRFKTRKVQPHNEVERKYREGLNTEFERLWRSLPSLMQVDADSTRPLQKPSKAVILSGAVEYIKSLEQERDTLKLGNQASSGVSYFDNCSYS